MVKSLRDRVTEALSDRLLESERYEFEDDDRAEVAADLTATAFAAMAGARPCVTCGKGIGPNKVARGYVQCYACANVPPDATADVATDSERA